MALSTRTTTSGLWTESLAEFQRYNSYTRFRPTFYTLGAAIFHQPNPGTQAIAIKQWTHLLLAYARHRRLFILRIEDSETTGNEWDEVLRNERVNRKLLPPYLSHILSFMVTTDVAAYEPSKQTRSVLLYWRSPDEWAEILHSWATTTGQLNTILTFYDITDPPIESELTGIPISLLRKAITILSKTNRAQMIGVADGEGVRIFAAGR
ncbi:hypothetical protein D9615_001718 [Tricholomella constricta]|uniref:ESCRT-II complex vps25 subunit n=1 Tax=Tricholomella constricta TaxID=117010 RepID=A0A8H5HPU1_9AGAR|nr:hypothetical protein D9615_001718 [Tricholomella constricta]